VKLSIIFGTYNRFAHLQKCVASVREFIGNLEYEIVVCDGGSTDGSREWLVQQPDIVTVADRKLTGAVVAFNHCYSVSSGEYIATLNDDTVVLNDALQMGVKALDADLSIGQVVFPFCRHIPGPFVVQHVCPPEHLYANFGVVRRVAAEAAVYVTGGLWNPVYYTYAADTELSVWVHRLGWRVVQVPDAQIYDCLYEDELRDQNHANGKAFNDGTSFWRRWEQGGIKEFIQPFARIPPLLTAREQERLRDYEEKRRAGKAGPHISG
jgi:GT2 family glycosyltransferase